MIIWPLLIGRLHLAAVLRRSLFSAFIPGPLPALQPLSQREDTEDRTGKGKENKAHLDFIHGLTGSLALTLLLISLIALVCLSLLLFSEDVGLLPGGRKAQTEIRSPL